MRFKGQLLLAPILWLAGCGTPGAPRPPSLRLPETVRDLAASRQGSTVTLTWSEPLRTTDGENIRVLGPTLVCMGVNDFPMTHCAQAVADLTLSQFAACKPEIGKPASCQITLAPDVQQKNPLGQATFAIEVLNTNGRSAGLSNQVRVPTAPTAPPLQDITARVTADGVNIQGHRGPAPKGEGVSFVEHVYRREAKSTGWTDLGEATPVDSGGSVFPLLTDKSAEWEKTYFYRVATLTAATLASGEKVEVRGEPSAEIEVFVHDVFPPATPQGVQAVASGVGQQLFVDLTWAPNTENDLAGYNVYRHEAGQAAVKITAEMVKAPSYRDASVQSGKTYFYSVSAVDLRRNESKKAAEATEAVH